MITASLRPILLVEDEADYASLVRESLRNTNIENPVRFVSTPGKAIDYLAGAGEFADRSEHPFPCLMLLDLRLGQESGFEVLRWLRRQEHLQGALNVVVLSVSNSPDEIRMAYELGAQFYMDKTKYGALETGAMYLKDSWLMAEVLSSPTLNC